MPVYDLVVVGGGPAGLSTALHLHALDPALVRRAVILEKERYPREKFCAGGIGGRAFATLRALGIDLDVPQVPFGRIAIRSPSGELAVEQPGFGAVVRRVEFDHALARETARRGIEVREGAAVRSVEPGPDRVRVTLASGETLDAKIVVGADGIGGAVRRGMGLDGGTLRAQVIECDTEPVESDPPRDTLLFDASDRSLGGYGWDFPTLVDGQEKVCRGVYVIRSLGADNVHDRLRSYLAARGLDMKDYRLKPFGERGFDPAAPLSVPRVLLVGEAAGIDIATGEGIAQAIQYGALAAPVLARALSGGDPAFSDWRARVVRSRLGRGLLFRTLIYRTFYFERARTERLLTENRAILDLFAQDFAGNRIRRRSVLSAALHTRPTDLPWLSRVAARVAGEAAGAARRA